MTLPLVFSPMHRFPSRPSTRAVWLVLLTMASVWTASAAAPAPAPNAAPVAASTAPAPILSAAGAFFALSVPDARASAAWYEEKLGLTVVMDPPKQGTSKVIVLEGGGLIVELVQDDQAAPRRAAGASNPMTVHGFAKAGVIVSDFEATLAALRQRKVEIAFGPYPAGKGQRANLIVRDADGNLLQFFGR